MSDTTVVTPICEHTLGPHVMTGCVIKCTLPAQHSGDHLYGHPAYRYEEPPQEPVVDIRVTMNEQVLLNQAIIDAIGLSNKKCKALALTHSPDYHQQAVAQMQHTDNLIALLSKTTGRTR